jgi:Carboxypeptidase regulatory-like domain
VKIHRAFPVVLTFLFLLAIAIPGRSQDNKQPDLRTVHGSVVDKDENPVPLSIVYLLNKKTLAIRTTNVDDEAKYKFAGLDPNVDYEIHAERESMMSSTRTISSFDSRRDMEITLKLTHKKGEK